MEQDLTYKGNVYDYQQIKIFLEDKGYTKAEVMKEIGISQTNLDRIIRKYNINYSFGGRTVNHFDIIAKLKSGKKKTQIARECGCGIDTVYRVAKKHGFIKGNS